jgi:hypothetical protein
MCRPGNKRRPVASPTTARACVNDLFLIRTEKARKTTGTTKTRMLLAEALTEQVIQSH